MPLGVQPWLLRRPSSTRRILEHPCTHPPYGTRSRPKCPAFLYRGRGGLNDYGSYIGGGARVGIGSRNDILEPRTALIHDELIAREVPGFAVEDQMEPPDEQVLEHLVKLLLRGAGRHGRNDNVIIPGRNIPEPCRSRDLIRSHIKGPGQ